MFNFLKVKALKDPEVPESKRSSVMADPPTEKPTGSASNWKVQPSVQPTSQPSLNFKTTATAISKWKSGVADVTKKLNLDPFRLDCRDSLTFAPLTPSDIIVASYPKSGNKLVSQIIAKLILYNSLSRDTGQEHVPENVPENVSEDVSENPSEDVSDKEHKVHVPIYETATIEEIAEMSSTTRRVFSSNFRYEYLQRNITGKLIYVIRNPEHAAIELYNSTFVEIIKFREFVAMFLDGGTDSPYNYKTHILQYIHNTADLDIMVLKFEDIEKRTLDVVREMAAFLKIDLSDLEPEDILEIVAEVREEGHSLVNWSMVAKSIDTKNFVTYFDNDIKFRFHSELKVNWDLVRSANI